MKKAMKLISNPVVFVVLNLIVYALYGILVGLSLFPSVLIVVAFAHIPVVTSFAHYALIALGLGLGVFVFLITGLLVFGLAERLLTLGFKPGTYSTDSIVFMRWIINAGVHTLCLNMILPFLCGSSFIKVYFKIIGCKFGRDVFFNSPGLHDAYLLEMGDNVVIGGKADVNCHIFEGNRLILDKVKIGSDVLIGAYSYIMPGVTIEDKCDVGAGSIIRKNRVIEAGSVTTPLPALPLRQTVTLMRIAKSGIKQNKVRR
ncbi:MAG: hypothetical protein FWG40_07725 [Peptococcaceae bacterium]|nr:hypothetical protein [Peptococcaceae bacterium]